MRAQAPGVCSYRSALFEAVGIFQGEHEGQRRECSNPLDLAQELGFRVAFFGDGFQLALVVADALCQRADRLKDGPKGRPERLGDVCSAALLWKLLAGHLGKRAPKDLTAPRT